MDTTSLVGRRVGLHPHVTTVDPEEHRGLPVHRLIPQLPAPEHDDAVLRRLSRARPLRGDALDAVTQRQSPAQHNSFNSGMR